MTKALWGQLTDAIEKNKRSYLTLLNKQYIDFVDNFESEKTLSRLYWADLIYSSSNSELSDSMVDIPSWVKL